MKSPNGLAKVPSHLHRNSGGGGGLASAFAKSPGDSLSSEWEGEEGVLITQAPSVSQLVKKVG